MQGISTILPVYFSRDDQRTERLLRDAMESVLTQSPGWDLELILIDDGSPVAVESRTGLRALLSAPNVRLVRLPRNHGLVNALNTGLAMARYPWIARIDADDTWADGKLQRQIAHIEADQDLTIVGTGMHLVDGDGRQFETHIRPDGWGNILEFTARVGCPFPHGSILARRSVFETLGGYDHAPELRHCEDFALWCQWLRFFKAGMVESALYNYTVSAGQISQQHQAQQCRASGRVHGEFLKWNIQGYASQVVPELARSFGVGLGDFSHGLATAWRWFDYIVTTDAYVDNLRRVLPDRTVLSWEELPNSYAERFCYFAPDASAVPAELHTRVHSTFADLQRDFLGQTARQS